MMATGTDRTDGLILHSNWRGAAPEEHVTNGQSWWFEYLAARYNRGRMVDPPGVRLSVRLPHHLAESLFVCPEDGWDRTVRALGLSREFQTGTPDVDTRFMLSGVVDDDLAGVFRAPETHRALQTLFDLGFTRISIFDDRIRATCRPWTKDVPDPDPPEMFVRAAAALDRLRAGVVSVPDRAPTSPSRIHHAIAPVSPITWVAIGFFGSAVILLGLSLTSFLSGADLLVTLGGWSALAGAAAALALAAIIRTYAFRGRTLVALFFAAFSLVFALTLTTLSVLNETLDRSPAVGHADVITSKWVSGGRHTSYYISTPAWRSDHTHEEFQLSQGDWLTVRAGTSRYVVHSKAGFFGVEWLADQTVEP